jgi:hypothetical protein
MKHLNSLLMSLEVQFANTESQRNCRDDNSNIRSGGALSRRKVNVVIKLKDRMKKEMFKKAAVHDCV